MGSIVQFNHYTSERGLLGIINSGQIKNSRADRNHAHFGEGCYGTGMPPWRGKADIAWNNWGPHGTFYIDNGKMEWAINVKIPKENVRKAPWKPRRNQRPRDILVHAGPVSLSQYEWRALRVSGVPDPKGCRRVRGVPFSLGRVPATTYTDHPANDLDDYDSDPEPEPVRYVAPPPPRPRPVVREYAPPPPRPVTPPARRYEYTYYNPPSPRPAPRQEEGSKCTIL